MANRLAPFLRGGLACLLVSAVAFMAVVWQGHAAPLAVPHAVDFGRVIPEQRFEGQFTVVNRSGKAVQIAHVTADCGCTIASSQDQVIAPHGSTNIAVAFDPHGRYGAVQRSVQIATADGRIYQTALFFDVPFTIQVAPGEVNLPPFSYGEPLPGAEVELVRSLDVAKPVLRLRDPAQPWSVHAAEWRRDGDAWRCKLEIQPKICPAVGLGSVDLAVLVGGTPHVVRVNWRVLPTLRATPAMVFLDSADPVECRLTSSSITIEQVSSAEGLVSASLSNQNGERVLLVKRLGEPATGASLYDTVSVSYRLADGRREQLTIPVTFGVTAADLHRRGSR